MDHARAKVGNGILGTHRGHLIADAILRSPHVRVTAAVLPDGLAGGLVSPRRRRITSTSSIPRKAEIEHDDIGVLPG
jgi:hypothetical protein